MLTWRVLDIEWKSLCAIMLDYNASLFERRSFAAAALLAIFDNFRRRNYERKNERQRLYENMRGIFFSRLIDGTHSKCALHFQHFRHTVAAQVIKKPVKFRADKITATRLLATTLSYFCTAISQNSLPRTWKTVRRILKIWASRLSNILNVEQKLWRKFNFEYTTTSTRLYF